MDGGYRKCYIKTFFWTPDTGLGFDHVTRIRIPNQDTCKYMQCGWEVLAKQTQQ